MPLGAFKAALMGTAGVSTADVVLLHDTDYSNATTAAITSGINSTYGEYIFKFYNINPATDAATFYFYGSTDGGSNYGVTKTTTFGPYANHDEATDANTNFGYHTSKDVAQATDPHHLSYSLGNGADESLAGELHLFNPASTTYVKHFYSRTVEYLSIDYAGENNSAGYFNTTSAITAVKFAFSSGNFDGTIKMWGVK